MGVIIEHHYQEAVNFETLVHSMGRSETAVEPLFEDLASKIQIDRPMIEYVSDYRAATGLSTKVLLDAYHHVLTQFTRLSHEDIVLKRGSIGYPTGAQVDSLSPRYIYARGNLDVLSLPTVVITGSRTPSGEGKRTAQESTITLGRAGYSIVSGMALGIDGIVHLTCVASNIPTIAVLSTSLIEAYPAQHAALQDNIAEHGLLLSRFSPVHKAQKWYMPLRARFMSSIASATIVVEERDGGAAVRQAEYALEQGHIVVLFNHLVENRVIQWPKKIAMRPGVVTAKQAKQLPKLLSNVLSDGQGEHDLTQQSGQLTLF